MPYTALMSGTDHTQQGEPRNPALLLLGVPDDMNVIQALEQLTPAQLGDLAGRLNVAVPDLCRTLSVPDGAATLHAPAAEKAYRLAELALHAEAYFGSADAARTWLTRRHAAYGGRSPLETALRPMGAEHMNLTLMQAEYGLFS